MWPTTSLVFTCVCLWPSILLLFLSVLHSVCDYPCYYLCLSRTLSVIVSLVTVSDSLALCDHQSSVTTIHVSISVCDHESCYCFSLSCTLSQTTSLVTINFSPWPSAMLLFLPVTIRLVIVSVCPALCDHCRFTNSDLFSVCVSPSRFSLSFCWNNYGEGGILHAVSWRLVCSACR